VGDSVQSNREVKLKGIPMACHTSLCFLKEKTFTPQIKSSFKHEGNKRDPGLFRTLASTSKGMPFLLDAYVSIS